MNRQKQTADACKQHRWGQFTDIKDIKKEMLKRLETHFDKCLCKGGFSGRGKIVTKGGKSAIVGCSELDQRYEIRSFQHAVSHLLGSFDFWIDRVDNPDKHTSWRVQIIAHNLQNAP
ncbi:MAG TPA: hypothetical protein VE860_27020, partial [Chthoniobacterales bacterium]|nr:hypothetical protein [Chthoniobacterales bacterium]